jgi:hypothetical protein
VGLWLKARSQGLAMLFWILNSLNEIASLVDALGAVTDVGAFVMADTSPGNSA